MPEAQRFSAPEFHEAGRDEEGGDALSEDAVGGKDRERPKGGCPLWEIGMFIVLSLTGCGIRKMLLEHLAQPVCRGTEPREHLAIWGDEGDVREPARLRVVRVDGRE